MSKCCYFSPTQDHDPNCSEYFSAWVETTKPTVEAVACYIVVWSVGCPSQGKACCCRAKDSKGRHRFAEVWEAQCLVERWTNAEIVFAKWSSYWLILTAMTLDLVKQLRLMSRKAEGLPCRHGPEQGDLRLLLPERWFAAFTMLTVGRSALGRKFPVQLAQGLTCRWNHYCSGSTGDICDNWLEKEMPCACAFDVRIFLYDIYIYEKGREVLRDVFDMYKEKVNPGWSYPR